MHQEKEDSQEVITAVMENLFFAPSFQVLVFALLTYLLSLPNYFSRTVSIAEFQQSSLCAGGPLENHRQKQNEVLSPFVTGEHLLYKNNYYFSNNNEDVQ